MNELMNEGNEKMNHEYTILLLKNDRALQKHMTPGLIWGQKNFPRESIFWKLTEIT